MLPYFSIYICSLFTGRNLFYTPLTNFKFQTLAANSSLALDIPFSHATNLQQVCGTLTKAIQNALGTAQLYSSLSKCSIWCAFGQKAEVICQSFGPYNGIYSLPALSLICYVSMSGFSTHVSTFSQFCHFPYVASPWSFSFLLFTSPTVSLLNNFH